MFMTMSKTQPWVQRNAREDQSIRIMVERGHISEGKKGSLLLLFFWIGDRILSYPMLPTCVGF